MRARLIVSLYVCLYICMTVCVMSVFTYMSLSLPQHIWSEYTYNIPEAVYAFSETTALLNSALNPILYGCFNMHLKSGLVEVCCPHRVREHQRSRCQSRASLSLTNDRILRTTRPPPTGRSDTSGQRLQDLQVFAKSVSGSISGGRHCEEPDLEHCNGLWNREHFVTEENQKGFKLRVRFVNNSEQARGDGESMTRIYHDRVTSLTDCLRRDDIVYDVIDTTSL